MDFGGDPRSFHRPLAWRRARGPRWRRAPQGQTSPLQQTPDDLVGLDAVRFRLEVDEHAMAKHGERDGADVLEIHDGAPFEQRAGFAAEQERLPRARTRTPAHPLAHELG